MYTQLKSALNHIEGFACEGAQKYKYYTGYNSVIKTI